MCDYEANVGVNTHIHRYTKQTSYDAVARYINSSCDTSTHVCTSFFPPPPPLFCISLNSGKGQHTNSHSVYISGIVQETNNTSKVCSLQIKSFCLLSHLNVKSLNNNPNYCNNRLWKCNRHINIPHVSSFDNEAQMSSETYNGTT